MLTVLAPPLCPTDLSNSGSPGRKVKRRITQWAQGASSIRSKSHIFSCLWMNGKGIGELPIATQQQRALVTSLSPACVSAVHHSVCSASSTVGKLPKQGPAPAKHTAKRCPTLQQRAFSPFLPLQSTFPIRTPSAESSLCPQRRFCQKVLQLPFAGDCHQPRFASMPQIE